MPRELRWWDRGHVIYASETLTIMESAVDGDRHAFDTGDARLVADVPRERVEALHAGVVKRMEMLERDGMAGWVWRDDGARAAYSDLSEVAEALRLLLEVTDDAA